MGRCRKCFTATAALVAIGCLGAEAAPAAEAKEPKERLADLRSVVVGGKVYKRLTGKSLRAAVVCKAYMLPPPQDYHGEGEAFGRAGKYFELSDRYGGWEGRYTLANDSVAVSIPELSSRERLVFFRSDDGGVVYGAYWQDAEDWRPFQRVVKDACSGERG